VRVAYYEDCLVERKSLTDGGWVCAPKAVFLMHGGREFQVRVDPSNLAPGRVYYAEVQGFVDVEHSSDPVFRLPITVIKPYLLTPQPLQSLLDNTPPNSTVETGQASELLTSGAASPSTRDGALLELNSENDTVALDDNGRTSKRAQARGVSLGCVTFRPGHRRRLFVQPPSGSTWADIIIQPIKLHSKVQCFIGLFARDFRVSLLVCALSHGWNKGLYVLHATQLMPHSTTQTYQQWLQLEEENRIIVKSFAVFDCQTLEVHS